MGLGELGRTPRSDEPGLEWSVIFFVFFFLRNDSYSFFFPLLFRVDLEWRGGHCLFSCCYLYYYWEGMGRGFHCFPKLVNAGATGGRVSLATADVVPRVLTNNTEAYYTELNGREIMSLSFLFYLFFFPFGFSLLSFVWQWQPKQELENKRNGKTNFPDFLPSFFPPSCQIFCFLFPIALKFSCCNRESNLQRRKRH